jgi:hypothetical protein
MPALPRRTPRTLASVACTLVALALPAAATAQPAALTVEASSPSASVAATLATPLPMHADGPLLDGTRAGAVPSVVPDAGQREMSDAARMRASGLRESQIMMIVGGAAVVLGFVTGDTAGDILILGGAAVGLAGLSFYLH